MELNIEVINNNNCKVIVKDLSEYLPEDSELISKGKFKFSDTVTLDVIQHNKSQETIYTNYVFSINNDIRQTELPVTFDGWLTITHIVMPSKEWFENELSKEEGSTINIYDSIYFSDGETVYKYVNESIEEVTIQEVVEINPVNTTISKISEDLVSICFLRKCYINLCNQIFNSKGFSLCFSNNKINSELIYRRDIVWMTINVIKYLTEEEQLAEVERLIELISGCNGLCQTNNNVQSNGCGCY